jgi:ornithine cyclodeaminase/alanine dehydrogenase-like protein (mu-crystallin family)
MENEKGAPSMYLLTKELYEAKENMFYDALEDSLNDTETLCQHLKRKKEESELLKNLNNI